MLSHRKGVLTHVAAVLHGQAAFLGTAFLSPTSLATLFTSAEWSARAPSLYALGASMARLGVGEKDFCPATGSIQLLLEFEHAIGHASLAESLLRGLAAPLKRVAGTVEDVLPQPYDWSAQAVQAAEAAGDGDNDSGGNDGSAAVQSGNAAHSIKPALHTAHGRIVYAAYMPPPTVRAISVPTRHAARTHARHVPGNRRCCMRAPARFPAARRCLCAARLPT